MDIRDWAAQNNVVIRIERASTTILHPDGSQESSEDTSVSLFVRVTLSGETHNGIVERGGQTLAEAMASLCAALYGAWAMVKDKWIEIPKLEYIR